MSERIQNVGDEAADVAPYVILGTGSKMQLAPTREPVTALMKKVVAEITSEYLPHLEGFRVSLAVVDIVVICESYDKPAFALYWRHKLEGLYEWTSAPPSPEWDDGTPLDWIKSHPDLLPLFGPEVWLEIQPEDIEAWPEAAVRGRRAFDIPVFDGDVRIECRGMNPTSGGVLYYVYRRETGHDVAHFDVAEGELYFSIDKHVWLELRERLPDNAKIIFAPTNTSLRAGDMKSSSNGLRVKAGLRFPEVPYGYIAPAGTKWPKRNYGDERTTQNRAAGGCEPNPQPQ